MDYIALAFELGVILLIAVLFQQIYQKKIVMKEKLRRILLILCPLVLLSFIVIVALSSVKFVDSSAAAPSKAEVSKCVHRINDLTVINHRGQVSLKNATEKKITGVKISSEDFKVSDLNLPPKRAYHFFLPYTNLDAQPRVTVEYVGIKMEYDLNSCPSSTSYTSVEVP
jgi:hypothetical protein